MKKRTLLAAGLVSLLVFAIALTPASLLRLLLPQQQGVELGRLSGTLWNGRATSVRYQQHRLDDLHWELLPSRLLLGRLALRLEANYQQHPLATTAALGIDRTLRLDDTTSRLPVSLLAQYLPLPMGRLDGELSVDMERVILGRDTVPLARGTLDWNQASITVAETAQLGDVKIELDGIDSGKLIAKLGNQGGDLVLDGDAGVEADGEYMMTLRLVAGKSAGNNVKNSLSMFAKPQPDGSYTVENSGNIFELSP